MPTVEELILKVDTGRCVGIQITNNTKDVTLENPRFYCFSGHVKNDPESEIRPGSLESCVFEKTSYAARGSVGVLSYDSDAFTLAIMFSNPFDRVLYNSEFALELFPDRKHFESMERLYQYMYSHRSPFKCESFRRTELKETQDDKLNVRIKEIQVKATISNGDKAIIKVQIEKNEPCPPYTPHAAYPGQSGK
ncbi:DELTA-thalatoxin-Avl1a-like [Emydura macquarii macquarii]|uniref:DELTA-thalatoxin-Avl1a-like n=1 Tax=Emydura macquarii macquarii TaxID=1129001 RepID=UPI00352A1AB9